MSVFNGTEQPVHDPEFEKDYRNFLPIKRRIALRANSICESWSESCVESPRSSVSDDSGIEVTDLDTPDSQTIRPTNASEREVLSLVCRWNSCGLTVQHLDDLVNHVNDAHIRADRDLTDYRCYWEGCPRHGKGFNARYKMLIHIRTHTNEKPYSCELCAKSFSRLENLKIHNRSHTGERPYICPFEGCGKAYSNSSDRFKHVRTHQEQKPYVCRKDGCGKRYTDPSSLRKHVKTHGHYMRQEAGQSATKKCKLDDGPVASNTPGLISKEQKETKVIQTHVQQSGPAIAIEASRSTKFGPVSDIVANVSTKFDPVSDTAAKLSTTFGPAGNNGTGSSTNTFSSWLQEYCREKYLVGAHCGDALPMYSPFTPFLFSHMLSVKHLQQPSCHLQQPSCFSPFAAFPLITPASSAASKTLCKF